MNALTVMALVNLGICAAVSVACVVTASAWPLLGLIFLIEYEKTSGKS